MRDCRLQPLKRQRFGTSSRPLAPGHAMFLHAAHAEADTDVLPCAHFLHTSLRQLPADMTLAGSPRSL